MITAKEAYDIALSKNEHVNIKEALDYADKEIRKASENGRIEARLGTDLFVKGGYNNTKEYKEVKRILEALGFKVEFFYEENQYINMYTIIKWSKE